MQPHYLQSMHLMCLKPPSPLNMRFHPQRNLPGGSHTLKKYPYLVAEKDHTILGYAYAGPFHERAAYDWAVETSIYVDQNLKHSGIGRLLHDALENALKKQGILNMNACIACTPTEDPHLNNNSVEFHTHMGYRLVGEFYQCGYKFRTWYNMVWMEKQIGEHLTDQPEIRKFRDIESEICYRKFMK